MGRHKQDDSEYIVSQLLIVTACIVEHRRKTFQDLREVAYRWCIKDYQHGKDVADAWGVAPMYLIHAALLYVEHPLLVTEGRGWKYDMVRMQAEILRVVVGRLDVDIPISSTNSIHSPVDKIASLVDGMR